MLVKMTFLTDDVEPVVEEFEVHEGEILISRREKAGDRQTKVTQINITAAAGLKREE